MKDIDLGLEQYIGADIVDQLVESNRRKFQEPWREFVKLDMTKGPLPHADAILCRDCLVHLSIKEVLAAIEQVRLSSAWYFIATNHVDSRENVYILTGYWRPPDLTKPPFNLPPPIESIDEQSTENEDKRLSIWRVDEMRGT